MKPKHYLLIGALAALALAGSCSSQRMLAAIKRGNPAASLVLGKDVYVPEVKEAKVLRDTLRIKDDDGRAWHVFASEDNSTVHVAELTDDYLDYTGRWWRIAELDWTEAVAICKKNGWYYLIGSGCTGWKPNAARSYRARSMTGPWERTGNPCAGVNPANGLGPELTWGGQSNYILKKSEDEYIAMFDIWKPENQVDSRLVWLPVIFNSDGTISIQWN